jgi:hypothetical protein
MIETFSIPILVKAVDFLFEEGSKILQERRERRKAEQEVDKAKPEIVSTLPSGKADVGDAITSREVILSQQIPKSVWLDSEAEIEHLMTLSKIHTRNYHLAKEQYAKWGSALVPPIIVNNLIEAEDAVATTMKDLQLALAKVYGKQVIVPEVEQT